MNKYSDIKDELNQYIDEGLKLYNSLVLYGDNKKNIQYFTDNYDQWYSVSQNVVKQLLPDRYNDFIFLYKDTKRKSISVETYTISDALNGLTESYSLDWGEPHLYRPLSALTKLSQQINILKACLSVFDSRLKDIQGILRADLFDSELDAAKHLFGKGFLRAAGAICGVLIEKHLADTAIKHNIKICKKDPAINDLNEILKKNDIIVIEMWRFITRMGDLRNLCDHNKKEEPTKEQVKDLIDGTDKVIKEVY